MLFMLCKAYFMLCANLKKGVIMIKTDFFATGMPSALSISLLEFGTNLQTARKRRKLSLQQVADKLNIGVRSIADAEKGKPTTAVSTYFGLLWVYGMLDGIKDVANPLKDIEGMRLDAVRKKKPVKSEYDNDF